jgi:transcriptional regulator with XRE-family HTH domain
MDAVRDAASAKREAEASYRGALVAAKAEGRSVAEIAKAAGVTRSAVYQVLRGEAKRQATDETAMTARLAVLDARWDALVDAVSETFMPADPRAEQAIRNGTNAKAKRTLAGVNRSGKASGSIGRHRVILPTVRQEARNLAEAKILRSLENNPQEPRVVAIVAELDEAYALRQQLTALRDTRVFGSPV